MGLTYVSKYLDHPASIECINNLANVSFNMANKIMGAANYCGYGSRFWTLLPRVQLSQDFWSCFNLQYLAF